MSKVKDFINGCKLAFHPSEPPAAHVPLRVLGGRPRGRSRGSARLGSARFGSAGPAGRAAGCAARGAARRSLSGCPAPRGRRHSASRSPRARFLWEMFPVRLLLLTRSSGRWRSASSLSHSWFTKFWGGGGRPWRPSWRTRSRGPPVAFTGGVRVAAWQLRSGRPPSFGAAASSGRVWRWGAGRGSARCVLCAAARFIEHRGGPLFAGRIFCLSVCNGAAALLRGGFWSIT